MPSYSDSVVPGARAAKDGSDAGATAQKTLECVAALAIVTACNVPLYTATFSIAGATSQNAQYILELLHVHGYTATVAGTTVTVTWGN
jgi:hypothetical protein